MKLKLIPLILFSATLLPGCAPEKAKETDSASLPVVTQADAVASVNGTLISKKALDTLEKEISERSQGQTFPKEQLLEELVQRELLVQLAVQKKLDKLPETLEKIESFTKSVYSQAAFKDYLAANPVTDEEIKAEYDSKTANIGNEYKAKHILVKTEEEAKKIIAELEKGADFTALAKKYSTDPSKDQGGDLGWFTADRMVAPFSEAVIALQNGEFTKSPVQTQYGWHVILKEDTKPLTAPPLDAVKEQIRPMLQRQKALAMIETLRKAAKIETYLPKATPAAEAKVSETQPATEATGADTTSEPKAKSETPTEAK